MQAIGDLEVLAHLELLADDKQFLLPVDALGQTQVLVLALLGQLLRRTKWKEKTETSPTQPDIFLSF